MEFGRPPGVPSDFFVCRRRRDFVVVVVVVGKCLIISLI